MLLKATFVAATAAVLVPLAGGTAHASCVDDLRGTSPTSGYSVSPKSEYWLYDYAQVSGTATVEFHGDALVSDYSSFAVTDMPNYTTIVVNNTSGAALAFVDCVAG